MTGRPWWGPVLQWGLWAVVMGVVMGWIARSRHRSPVPHQAGVLVQLRSMLIIGIACSGFFRACAVGSSFFPGKTGTPLISLFFLGFAALGVPIILDYRNARHQLTSDGLGYGKMLGGGGQLRRQMWVPSDTRREQSGFVSSSRMAGLYGSQPCSSVCPTSLGQRSTRYHRSQSMTTPVACWRRQRQEICLRSGDRQRARSTMKSDRIKNA